MCSKLNAVHGPTALSYCGLQTRNSSTASFSRLHKLSLSLLIYEKSQCAAEIGAAIFVSPNGTHVLSQLGFSFSRARGRKIRFWRTLNGTSLANISTLDFRDAKQRYGAIAMSVHCVDLHNELLRLISKENKDAKAPTLQLGAKVVNASTEEGLVELEDGTHHRADLIVASDGQHSVLRNVVLGYEAPATLTGLNAFRFLLPTAIMRSDLKLEEMLQWKGQGTTILVDTQEVVKERHLVWYDCREYACEIFFSCFPKSRLCILT